MVGELNRSACFLFELLQYDLAHLRVQDAPRHAAHAESARPRANPFAALLNRLQAERQMGPSI
jgi:hypothetical protein